MIKARLSDQQRAIEILSCAYEHNIRVCTSSQSSEEDLLYTRRLMTYAYRLCSIFGKVMLSDDRNACALILYPDRMGFSLKAFWWRIHFIFEFKEPIIAIKMLRREALIRRHYPKMGYYLWFIGVHPVHRGIGTGSNFIEELIADADRRSRPLCIDTPVLKHRYWCEKFGFELIKELNPGYPLFLLKRKAYHYFLNH